MKRNYTIKLRRRSQTGWLMWLLIMLPFLFALLDLVGIPYAVRYILDVAWLLLFLIQLWHRRKISGLANIKAWTLLFLIVTAMIYLVQFQSPLYYLWGLRNNFRFYAVFFSFATLLTKRDAEEYLSLFDKLFWINMILSLVQFYGMGYSGDHLGGLFGVETGANGYTNLFLLIVVTKSVLFYLEKQESAAACVAKCAGATVVAALAELKFFFVEAFVVITLAVLFTNFTWRKVWMILGGSAVMISGAALLTKTFPGFSGWFSVQWLLETALSNKGYTSSGDLNRLNAITQINALWLRNWGQRIFGLGLGNCDTSGFSFLNTPFFEQNGNMHYIWLSHAMIYLECGYIGLLFYFGFFVLVYLAVRRIEKRSSGVAVSYCRLARIMAVCCMIVAIYNSSLRTEAAYMVYFVLTIPFVVEKYDAGNKK